MPSVKQTSRSPASSVARAGRVRPVRRRRRARGRSVDSRSTVAVGVHEDRRIVAGVGVRRSCARRVSIDRVAERHELAGRDVAAEQPIDARADVVRLGRARVANARTAACRFDISSAAGRPLPTTSAIETADARVARSAARRSSRRRCRTRASSARRSSQPRDRRHRRRQQRALNQPRLVVLARQPGVAAARRRPSSTSRLHDFDERRVVPRLLHEALARRAASLRRRCRCCPSRSSRRSAASRRARARDRAGRGPRGRTSCRACSSDPSAAGRTAVDARDRCTSSTELTRSVSNPASVRSSRSACRMSV